MHPFVIQTRIYKIHFLNDAALWNNHSKVGFTIQHRRRAHHQCVTKTHFHLHAKYVGLKAINLNVINLLKKKE